MPKIPEIPPFRLTLAAAVAAARLAYTARRLGAQCGQRRCRYRYADGSVCAIGAALPDAVAKKVDRDGGGFGLSVSGLKTHGVVAIRASDMPDLVCLQEAHDRWLMYRDDERETLFTQTLAQLESKIAARARAKHRRAAAGNV